MKDRIKTLLDRPLTTHIKNWDRMTTELSPYMTELEIDACVDFMCKLEGSIGDSNPSINDCKTQMELMFGRDRFLEICKKWNEKNQKFLTVFGKLKYKCNKTGMLYDGLDPDDDPNMFEKVYV